MISQLTKDMFAKLECTYEPVAMKFVFEKPKDIEPVGKSMALCVFVKEAQTTHRKFYTCADDDECMGKMVLGMIDIPPLEGSGQAGYDFEVFKTQAPNARLYHKVPMLKRDAHRYVIFSPLSLCDFDPDLIVVVADTRQADIIMRANSYVSGDLWESKDSHVIGCGWQYVYPYLSGKINHTIVGMHYGQKVRKPYPDGMQIITIPYQKIDEVTKAMSEMHWVPISMRPEDKDELQRRIDRWAELDSNHVLKQV